MLHGATGISDHTGYKPAFTALAGVAQIVYVDLAGAGRSDLPPDGFSLEAWADDIVELCDALHITKPVVLGNSAGGMVAAMYAILLRWRARESPPMGHSQRPGKTSLGNIRTSG